MSEGHVRIPETEPRFFGLQGRRISGDPADQGTVGVVGLAATPKRVNAARRFYPELNLEAHGDLFADEAGALYRIAGFNPLLTESPGEADVAGFAIGGDNTLVFLQRSSRPATVDELEQQQIEQGRDAAANEKAHAEFLREQPQLVALLPGAPCELAESVRILEGHGGRITAGKHGEVVVTLPARLVDSDNVLDGQAEGERRRSLDQHIQSVVHCWRVIVPLLASRSSKPLSERVPSGYPSAGGGVT
jgi:hypothetical protein